MPGTNTNWNVAATSKMPGQLWSNLAIPLAGTSLSLHTDGTPDSTANPTARHLGMTREGAQFLVKPTFENDFADEFANPIRTSIGDIEAAISAELLQVTDFDLLELLTPGLGTKGTGTGFERVQFGRRDLAYTSVALIFPLEVTPVKYAVFHLYKALNQNGIEMGVGRKTMAGIPVMFKGFDIISRAQADTVGQMFKQV